ncbi:MAG TPA: hypothetical protein VF482_22825 [Trebonia sp.]
MQILVVCRPAQGGDQSEFRRFVSAEGAALRELKERGVLSNAWTPGRPGAVLMLNVGTEDDAAAIAAALPLAAAGLITTEVIPLYPMNL